MANNGNRGRRRAVIFDIDGVIFDTERIHLQAWANLFERIGVQLGPADYRRGVGVADQLFLAELKRNGRVPRRPSIEALLNSKEKEVERLVAAGGVRVFPGVPELLTRLDGRADVCGASNSTRSYIRAFFSGHPELQARFRFILTRDDIRHPKPAPDIYLACSRRIGIAPADCLVIEDSPVGIEAARRAGMRCLAVTNSLPAARLGGAGRIVKRLGYRTVIDLMNIDGGEA
ncbi:MAG TPA: HAD family phosphatase [bacterium]|uniref:Fructose-1-phosphate phosphatase YqaB n=1 Tax=candidate division TA06 bacterium ADurb.Bin417 TaxID=1852828 RepID=A0A1V5MDV3_UNCT6|nr:MAG: Fructose-1-phosphate phosphatase YqaB [candidate division TA06 bacterium ADurb.Bin417]HNQ35192.1 HAD family phosphatase [bacterium]HNS48445.1 HAD family phosphatase [bacterium]